MQFRVRSHNRWSLASVFLKLRVMRGPRRAQEKGWWEVTLEKGRNKRFYLLL